MSMPAGWIQARKTSNSQPRPVIHTRMPISTWISSMIKARVNGRAVPFSRGAAPDRRENPYARATTSPTRTSQRQMEWMVTNVPAMERDPFWVWRGLSSVSLLRSKRVDVIPAFGQDTYSRGRYPPPQDAGRTDQPAGKDLKPLSDIRVAIVGVGNCANSLVQGVDYYGEVRPDDSIPGLMNVQMGDYHVGDLRFVTAFDVDAAKVGLDVSKAMWASTTNTVRFAEVGDLGTEVLRGPTLDGLGFYYRDSIEESMTEPVDVVAALREARVDVLVNYLPVGSEQATRFYAEAALEARVGFVNCIPVFVASDRSWATRFHAAGIPIIGDDIKSQVGATIVHRALARLFEERGVDLERTMQLNVGGNMDFKNIL